MRDFELIVIGASLGGLTALQTLFGLLEPSFSLPIAVVVHRQEGKFSELANLLQKHAGQSVVEPEDKTKITAGGIYLAPMGYHLSVDEGYFSLAIDQPVHFARPSIDVLFDSAAFSKNERLIAILLTGSGTDGVWGLKQVQRYGGRTIVQDPESAESRDLPLAALNHLTPDEILSINGIGSLLNRL